MPLWLAVLTAPPGALGRTKPRGAKMPYAKWGRDGAPLMQLVVLGNADEYLAPGSGGSGYLIETAQARVLLDCGGGVADALRSLGGAPLDAIVVSHFHHDHVLDLVRLLDLTAPHAPLIIPPGERQRLDALAQAFTFDGEFTVPGGIVEARPGTDGALVLGNLRLDFAPTQHGVTSVATRVTGPTGAQLVYASDSAPCASLAALAREAELLLMHTLLPAVADESPHAAVHATAQSAGVFAQQVGARELVLSHRYHESSDALMLSTAAAAFDRVRLASSGELRLLTAPPKADSAP